MSLCYSDSMRHKWQICKINLLSIFILTYECLKTALQNISGGPWPTSLCGSTSLKSLICKNIEITKMWFRKMLLLALKTQNYEKLYKIKLLKQQISHIVFKYLGNLATFVAIGAFPMSMKSVRFYYNFTKFIRREPQK